MCTCKCINEAKKRGPWRTITLEELHEFVEHVCFFCPIKITKKKYMLHKLFHFKHSQCLHTFTSWVQCFPRDILHIIVSFLEAEELVYCGNIFKPDWDNLLKYFCRKYDVPYVNRPYAKIVLYDTILYEKCIMCSSKLYKYPLCFTCFNTYMIEDNVFIDIMILIPYLFVCYIPIILLTHFIFDGLVFRL